IWKKICKNNQIPDMSSSNYGIIRVEETRVKQEIFFKALLGTYFNVSHACQLAGTNVANVREKWMLDKEFKRLYDEIQNQRGDFYETALMKLVDKGDPTAVIFVNKTYNKDRGYHEKIKLEIGRSEQDQVIEKEKLSLETRRLILEEIRSKEKLQLTEVIDAEVISVDLPE